jgi:hypothetical protein
MLQVHHVIKRHGPSYYPTTNCAPYYHFLVMKWDFIYCVAIFGVPVTKILGIQKATKMKISLVAKKKRHVGLIIPL